MTDENLTPPPQKCDIDVILPCYNPPVGWIGTIATQLTSLRAMHPDRRLHLMVSNDGSQRNTTPQDIEQLMTLVADAEFVDYPTNMGKGAALRRAVALSKAPLVLYTDIDLPYRTECMSKIIGLLDQSYDIAMAARNHTYYSELSPTRKLLSWGSRTMNHLVLGMKYPDAQGGLKGFNRRGRDIFLTTKVDRFLFDTEFIHKASKNRDIRIAQVETNLRDGIHLPGMGMKVIRREFLNFLKIIFS